MGIRAARKKAGLSVLAVAKSLGVSDAAVYLWETGQTTPRVHRLRELAELFGVSIDELLSEDG